MYGLELTKYVLQLRLNGYISFGNLPLHLCSVPLYVFPFVVFSKKKIKDWASPTAFFLFLPALLTLIYPSNVIYPGVEWSQNNFVNPAVISFAYHTLMFVFAFYLVVSKTYKVKGKDFLKVYAVMIVFAFVAVVFNKLIPGADYFMIGMGYGMPEPFISINNINNYLYIVTMVAVGYVVIFLLFLYWIIKDIRRKNKEKAILASKVVEQEINTNKISTKKEKLENVDIVYANVDNFLDLSVFLTKVYENSEYSSIALETKELLRHKNNIFLLAYYDKKLIGVSHLYINTNEQGAKNASLKTIYVLEEYRLLGVGSLLLKADYDVLTQKECKEVVVDFNKDREDLINFYKATGFIENKYIKLVKELKI